MAFNRDALISKGIGFTGSISKPVLVLLLAAISTVIRLPALKHHSLWYDEVSTAYIVSQPSLGELLKSLYTFEGTPPAFYLLEKSFIGVFNLPVNEVSLRALPLIFGVLTTILVFLIFDEVGKRRSALLSFFLVAFSSFHIYLSAEARSYGLLALFSLLDLLMAIHFSRKPDFLRTAILLGLLSITVQLHYYAIFWVSGILGALLILKRQDPVFRIRILLLASAALLSFLSLLPMFLGQVRHEVGPIRQYLVSNWFLGIFYAPIKVLIGSYLYKRQTVQEITAVDLLGIFPVCFIMCCSAIAFLKTSLNRKLGDGIKIAIFSVIITYCLYVAIGWKVPTIHPRYMANFLLLGFGLIIISVEKHRLVQYAFCATILILNCFGLANFYDRSLPYFEPWEDIANFTNDYFEGADADGKLVVADFSICNPVAYYLQDADVAFFASKYDSDSSRCTRINLFGHPFLTELFTNKFYPPDVIASFSSMANKFKSGIFISKDRSSYQKYAALKSRYGFLTFRILKIYETNQGQVAVFEWRLNARS